MTKIVIFLTKIVSPASLPRAEIVKRYGAEIKKSPIINEKSAVNGIKKKKIMIMARQLLF
jgi:hypothetical protein